MGERDKTHLHKKKLTVSNLSKQPNKNVDNPGLDNTSKPNNYNWLARASSLARNKAGNQTDPLWLATDGSAPSFRGKGLV
jgi:hypothetical protein